MKFGGRIREQRRSRISLFDGNRCGSASAVLGIVLLTVFSDGASEGVRGALRVCLDTLIPSLLPSMLLSSYLAGNLPEAGRRRGVFNAAGRLLSLPPGIGRALLPALLGGYPVGPRILAGACGDASLPRRQRERAFGLCFFPAPAFTLIAVGRTMFGSMAVGFGIYGAVLLSALFCAALFSLPGQPVSEPLKSRAENGRITLPEAARSAASGMLGVCLWTCIFGAVSGALNAAIRREIPMLALFGEVAAGCVKAASQGRPSLCAAICAFGGLCVHLQILPYLKAAGCGYLRFFGYRTIHAGAAYLAARFLFMLRPLSAPTLAAIPDVTKPALTSPVGAGILLALCVLLVTDGNFERYRNRYNNGRPAREEP